MSDHRKEGNPDLEWIRVCGAEIGDHLAALAALRMEVFREFPYLYAGDAEYERRYLEKYVDSQKSLAVLVCSGGEVVGASTCVPLADEDEAFQRPFLDNGMDPGDVFYLAESVLRREFRGRGIGKRFFDEREAHARLLGGFKYTAFCAVERPEDHSRCPAGYRPLDPFWESRGYRKQSHLRARFSWRDVDETEETEKALVFWLRPLGDSGR